MCISNFLWREKKGKKLTYFMEFGPFYFYLKFVQCYNINSTRKLEETYSVFWDKNEQQANPCMLLTNEVV